MKFHTIFTRVGARPSIGKGGGPPSQVRFRSHTFLLEEGGVCQMGVLDELLDTLAI